MGLGLMETAAEEEVRPTASRMAQLPATLRVLQPKQADLFRHPMASSPGSLQWLNPSRSLGAKLALLAFFGSAAATLVVAYASGGQLIRTLEDTARQEFEIYAE